jgi:C4-dicarboxylate-specific signal transduction histidine kinase
VSNRLRVSDGEARRLAELGLLTAGLIHELRQPVFAIKALAQLSSASPERAADLMRQVLEQAHTLETLLSGYGDFSRRPGDAAEVFDVGTPLRSALVILQHRAHASGVPIVVEADAPVAVRGSVLAVQQAIVNLGQNAIDALRGREGGRLLIAAGARDGGACVRVEDNGPGLPPPIRKHLFEPFWTTKPQGTGLGLSITRDLVVASGGQLRLLDAPGTAWEITLPGPENG